MAKAASAEIGNKRYYHHIPEGCEPCDCGERISPACQYALLSVTTILDVLPKPWMGPWAAKIAAEVAVEELGNIVTMAMHEGPAAAKGYIKGAPWRKRDAAADRGTATHEAAELGTAIEDVPGDVKGKVLAWHLFLDDYQPDIEYQEATIYNPLEGYAGTADLFLGLDERAVGPLAGRWLIDIKTGVMSWAYRLQQAAYRFGLFVGDRDGTPLGPVPWADHVGILSLTDDGYTLYEIEAGEREYEAFLLTARFGRTVEALQRIKDRKVGERKAAA